MASCNSTDILATAYRNGYAKLSSRDLMVAAIASACSTCNAQPLIETAIGLGYLKLSEFDAAMCIAESLCSSPGVTAAPAPTILKLAMQDHLAAMSRRDLDGVIAALLCKMTNPPCVTPATPGTPTAFSTLNNILKISWAQPPNSGSLILNYTVSYGTTQGGPYTSTVTVPAMTKQAILNGLTAGTTYYFVVKANSFTGCSSANSAEGSAATTGTPPVHLLTGLVHYYQMHSSAGPLVDSIGAIQPDCNGFGNGCGDFSTVAGPITNAVASSGAQGVDGYNVVTAANSTDRAALNSSQSYSFWIFIGNPQVSALTAFMAATSTNFYSFTVNKATGVLLFTYYDNFGAGVARTLQFPTVPSVNTWHHVVVGVDMSGAGTLFGYLDGVSQGTSAFVNGPLNPNVGSNFTIFNEVPQIGDPFGRMAEFGIWQRLLNAADVAALYNGGAGLPLASFT